MNNIGYNIIENLYSKFDPDTRNGLINLIISYIPTNMKELLKIEDEITKLIEDTKKYGFKDYSIHLDNQVDKDIVIFFTLNSNLISEMVEQYEYEENDPLYFVFSVSDENTTNCIYERYKYIDNEDFFDKLYKILMSLEEISNPIWKYHNIISCNRSEPCF